MKAKLIGEGFVEVYEKIVRLKLVASDEKMRETDCANTETMFRIVQSIPSPKVEPFKRWLAKTGYERVQEIEDPELATKRTRMLYKAKGYSDGWIEKRMRGIAIREELTEEWKNRGAREQRDYEILTAEISQATFGLKPEEYKKFKGLKRQNLRDHMVKVTNSDYKGILHISGKRMSVYEFIKEGMEALGISTENLIEEKMPEEKRAEFLPDASLNATLMKEMLGVQPLSIKESLEKK